jgi:hypothetical protein
MKRKITLKLKSSIKEKEGAKVPVVYIAKRRKSKVSIKIVVPKKITTDELELKEKEEWLKAVGAVNIENFKYMMPAGNCFLAEEYIKMTPLEKIKEDCRNAWRLAKGNRR